MASSDEDESIFNTNFVMRRSQSPPRGGDSLITTDQSRSHNSRDDYEDEESNAPSLNDLTSVSSRPDPRARANYYQSDLSGRSGISSGKTSDHSGSTRKASHRHQDVEARRRRRKRREEPLYEEDSEEDESTIVSYFSSLRGRGRGRRQGYSSGNRVKRSKGHPILRSVMGVFEGINVKTVVLCILAMVMVLQLNQNQHGKEIVTGNDVEDFTRATGFEKGDTAKKDESAVAPNVRGGLFSNPLAAEETADEDDDTNNSQLGNIGLYAEEEDKAADPIAAGEDTQETKDGVYAQKQSGILFQQPMNNMQGMKSGESYMQQPLGGYSNNQMGNQYSQTGTGGQYINPMMGGSYGNQGSPMGGQPGMPGQFNSVYGQQQSNLGGSFLVNGEKQPQLPGYPNSQLGMTGQYAQQQGLGGQYGQMPGGYPNSQSGVQSQFGQFQGIGGYPSGMQQPMHPGQISPVALGPQQMQNQAGFAQYPQQHQPIASQNTASSSQSSPELIASASGSAAEEAPAPAVASVEQASPVELKAESNAVPEPEVPLLKEVPKGYVPPAVPVSSTDSLPELNNFKDSWDPYEPTDIPMFWHIPKAGGSSIKDALGGCHRFIQATEFGVTDGHINDKEVAIVYPKVPGGADTDRSPFVNIDSSTVAGIQRAKEMGFADSQLADIVVSPFVFETNDLFTQTAKGRFFSVFRHPIDRAISMFYYIQVADWEPSYKPELKEWTLEQYAQSEVVENNWMTRQLSGQLGGELTDTNLQKAMEVVRRKFMVGLMTQIEPSMTRFEKFFRWKYKVNPTNQEACRARLMSGGSNSNKANKKPLPKEGEPAWDLLAHQNNFDLQLYKYIEQLFVEQEAFVAGIPDNYRLEGATCCKCDPPTFPPEGFTCPEAVKNG